MHTCASVFIAFLTVHCKTLENACMPWCDILVNVRTSEGTESAAFVPFRAGAKLWTNTTLSALFLGLWYGLLVRVLRCEPLERTNVLRMDIFVQMVINKSLNSAILSSKQVIKKVNSIKNISICSSAKSVLILWQEALSKRVSIFFTDFDGRRSNVGVFDGWRLSCRADGNQEDISSMSLS